MFIGDNACYHCVECTDDFLECERIREMGWKGYSQPQTHRTSMECSWERHGRVQTTTTQQKYLIVGLKQEWHHLPQNLVDNLPSMHD